MVILFCVTGKAQRFVNCMHIHPFMHPCRFGVLLYRCCVRGEKAKCCEALTCYLTFNKLWTHKRQTVLTYIMSYLFTLSFCDFS